MNREEQQRQQNLLDRIAGRGMLVAGSLAGEYLAQFLARMDAGPRDPFTIMATARKLLSELSPELGRTIATAQLAAWVIGNRAVADRLPAWAINRIAGAIPPIGAPPTERFPGFDGPDPILRFPLIERSAESLLKRQLLPAREYYAADDRIRNQSFTVAGDLTDRTMDTVRNILAEQVREGASYQDFKKAIAGELEGAFLSPWHAETVFRTNVQTSFREGRNTAARNPVVSAMFPYKRYVAIHDRRARPEHLRLEKLGLSGTDVYRADDPFWSLFDPPWDYNCRCGSILLTIEAAARLGVQEAREWLRTGNPPAVEHRLAAIPFRPRDGWTTGAYANAG
jgi:hypothetical protein